MDLESRNKFIKTELDRIRDRYGRGSSLHGPAALMLCRRTDNSSETFTEEKPAVQVFEMPGLSDQDSRAYLKGPAFKNDAFAISVALEAWYVAIPKDAPEELRRRCEEASARGELHLLEPPIRRERVMVYIETETSPIQRFDAELTREDPSNEESSATLGPWVEQTISVPRPNFKRYLPEIRDGKKALIVNFPAIPQDMINSFLAN